MTASKTVSIAGEFERIARALRLYDELENANVLRQSAPGKVSTCLHHRIGDAVAKLPLSASPCAIACAVLGVLREATK